VADPKVVIGLMSGTSVDGIDAALVEIQGSGESVQVNTLGYETYAYPASCRKRIFELFSPETGSVDKVCEMNFVLGELFAEAAQSIARRCSVPLSEVDLIGSHGQTVYHKPKLSGAQYSSRSTLQIAEPCVIAERTGVTVVADFRCRDIAAGGQGAPLVPYVDYLLFRDKYMSRAVQNIGGIANVTYIPDSPHPLSVIAFDTGPGNMMIDAAMEILSAGRLTYDKDGTWASRGTSSHAMMSELMMHPFIHADPPKTTGREEFGRQFVEPLVTRWRPRLSDYDIIATLTALTAESIAFSYRRFLGLIDEVILGGGGAQNPVLCAEIAKRIPDTKIMRHEDFGIPSEAKEAIAFAVLASEAMYGNSTNLPGATGAASQVVLGKIVPGANRKMCVAGWES